jgi:hypothetical protein
MRSIHHFPAVSFFFMSPRHGFAAGYAVAVIAAVWKAGFVHFRNETGFH